MAVKWRQRKVLLVADPFGRREGVRGDLLELRAVQLDAALGEGAADRLLGDAAVGQQSRGGDRVAAGEDARVGQ